MRESEQPATQDASTGGRQNVQVIAITGQPYLAEEPAFGAFVVFVPLNETPSDAWLQHLRAARLPGYAHRRADAGLVFNLDRNDQDVTRVMREIAAAIDKANSDAEDFAESDEKAAIKWESAMASKRAKVDKKLAEWWEEDGSKAPA